MLSVSIIRNNAVFYALILLSASLINGMAIKDKHFLLPENHKATRVYHHEEDGFYVVKNNTERYNIPSHDISKELRHCSKEELKGYLKTGFLELKKMSDESYKIEGHQRGIAGGPVLAYFFYTGTKALSYGGLAAAGTAAMVSTGGAVGGALGAALTLSSGAATTIAGGAIGGSVAATAGATTAFGAVMAAGPMMVIAGIETLSLMAGAAGAAIPWL